MRILGVYIKNFQGINELEADTNANIIVVNGVNGSGKTSFISAIEWCLCVNHYWNINLKKQETIVRLNIEQNGVFYNLEARRSFQNEEAKPLFFITKDSQRKEVKYNEYVTFVKEELLCNPYFDINFINALYYGSKKGIGINFSGENLKKINEYANKLGFPIPKRRLVFAENLDCDIYDGNRKLSGGYYSSGDNVLRMTVAKIIAVKFIEELFKNKSAEKNVLPLFIDDVFSFDVGLNVTIGLPYVFSNNFLISS